jgi:MATE family multidrug resistance protein
MLAYPVVLSHLAHMMVGVADSVMVGQLGKEPLAAVSFANSLFILFMIFGIGISYAITPLTAQADGVQNAGKLTDILKHGLLICCVAGVLLTAGIFGVIPFAHLLNQPAGVVQLAIPYLQVIGVSLLPFMLFQALRQFAEGLGYTRQAMYFAVASNALNIALNYVLIFGKLGMPAYGLFGAGLATLISRVVMAAAMLAFIYLDKRFTPFKEAFLFRSFQRQQFIKNLKLGIPMAFQLIFEVSMFSMSAIMMGWLGTVPLAAHQIALNLSAITYMMAVGLSAAATIRVGNQMGRADFTTMRQAALTSYLMVLVFMGITALVFIMANDWLPRLYIDNVEVEQMAASLLVIAAMFQLSDGLQAVGLGILRGLSDVKIPTYITLAAYWGVGIPLAYVLAFVLNWGPHGVWYGLLTGLSVAAILLYWRFRRVSAGAGMAGAQTG